MNEVRTRFDRSTITALQEPFLHEGETYWRCWWSKELVRDADAVLTSGMVPGVKTQFVAHPECYRPFRNVSRDAFNEAYANCNTCKHFIRKRTDAAKGKPGCATFIYGNCTAPDGKPERHPLHGHQYTEQIMLHPDDADSMPCHELRRRG